MRTILICSQKGGVGKTTLCINLSLYFAMNNVSVSLCDADAQGSATAVADLLPNLRLVSTKDVLADNADSDLVVVDTSPRNDVILPKLLAIADFVLIPVRAGLLDILSVKDTEAIIKQVGAEKKSAIVLNAIQHRNALTREVQEMLETFSIPVLKTRLFQRVAYTRSTTTQGVFNSDDTKAQAEIIALADEILDKL